jgi:UDP-galactopyranose mutase
VDINKYDILIVGCGFAGGIVAYLSATKLNKKVLILEKRNHIAGNMYDEKDPETGILVHRYGPHIFFTNKEQVYNLITEVGEWQPFTVKGRVDIDGQLMPSPFNYETIDNFFTREKAGEIKEHLAKAYPGQEKTTIVSLLNSEDLIVREYGKFLFEKDYKPYTIKQWGIKPEELDVAVLERVPIRLNYIDRLLDQKYQVLPKTSFTSFFNLMLDRPNIDIQLNIDANDHLALDCTNGLVRFDGQAVGIPVVYTGALDELMHYKYGKLPYRSIDFRYETHNIESFQETSFSIYPFAQGYTRITEYTKLPFQNGNGKTLVAYEYPVAYESGNGKIPYYPVLTDESKQLYNRYLEDVKNIENFIPCGRLADFQYYNMEDAIERAIDAFNAIKNQ